MADKVVIDRMVMGNVPPGVRESVKAATEKRLTADPVISKTFTEFFKISDIEDAKKLIKAMLGDEATLETFKEQFGVNIADFIGYFVEVGNIEHLDGTLVSGTISPIMVLRAVKENVYSVHKFEVDGLISADRRAAWVDRSKWENIIGT